MASTLFLAIIFSAGNPLLLVVTTVCATASYWRDKYLLLVHARVPVMTKARMSAVVARWLPIAVVLHLFVGAWMVSEDEFLYPAMLLGEDATVPGLDSFGMGLARRLASKHTAVLLLGGLCTLCAVIAVLATGTLGAVLHALSCRRGGGSLSDSGRVVLNWAVVQRAMGSQCRCCRRAKVTVPPLKVAASTAAVSEADMLDVEVKARRAAEEAHATAIRLLDEARGAVQVPPDFNGTCV
jgi:hypothetical protein